MHQFRHHGHHQHADPEVRGAAADAAALLVGGAGEFYTEVAVVRGLWMVSWFKEVRAAGTADGR